MKYLYIIAVIALMAACNPAAGLQTLEDPSPDQVIPGSDAGLSIQIATDVYSASPAEIEADLENSSSRSFEYGDYFYVEAAKEGDWYIVAHSDAVFIRNPQLIDWGYLLAPGTSVHQRFSLEMLGVELPAGEYRLVKTFLSQQQPYEEVSLAVQFTVK